MARSNSPAAAASRVSRSHPPRPRSARTPERIDNRSGADFRAGTDGKIEIRCGKHLKAYRRAVLRRLQRRADPPIHVLHRDFRPGCFFAVRHQPECEKDAGIGDAART